MECALLASLRSRDLERKEVRTHYMMIRQSGSAVMGG